MLFVLMAPITETNDSSDYGLHVQWGQDHCNSLKNEEEIEKLMSPALQINYMKIIRSPPREGLGKISLPHTGT